MQVVVEEVEFMKTELLQEAEAQEEVEQVEHQMLIVLQQVLQEQPIQVAVVVAEVKETQGEIL